MYYSFSSAYPAVIKLNGIYYGVISNTVKSCNIEGKPPLVEVCPLCNENRQVNFFPDTEFLNSPPNGVIVTDLKGGYLIKFLKNTKVGDFKVLDQKKEPNLLVTAFIENGLKISIETPGGFYVDTLDFFADNAKIFTFNLNSQSFCLVELKGERSTLAIYSLNEKTQRVFLRQVDEYSIDGGFFTTENFCDIAKHQLKSEWECVDGRFHQKNAYSFRGKEFDFTALNPKILPFAFLEELLCGGNTVDFLSDELRNSADRLKDYLGNFIGIMPPPVFRSPDEIGLIFANGNNKYSVKYIKVTVENQKVSNIKMAD